MISTTPADTPVTDTTPVGHIPLAGTWFAHVGLRPYQLLGLVERASTPRNPVRTLPRLDLAA